jgi:hypothetical protein
MLTALSGEERLKYVPPAAWPGGPPATGNQEVGRALHGAHPQRPGAHRRAWATPATEGCRAACSQQPFSPGQRPAPPATPALEQHPPPPPNTHPHTHTAPCDQVQLAGAEDPGRLVLVLYFGATRQYCWQEAGKLLDFEEHRVEKTGGRGARCRPPAAAHRPLPRTTCCAPGISSRCQQGGSPCQ